MQSSILDSFALDLVSNFLMQLASEEEVTIRAKLGIARLLERLTTWKPLLTLAGVLTLNNIGSTNERLIATVAALLQHNIFPPDPENEDLTLV